MHACAFVCEGKKQKYSFLTSANVFILFSFVHIPFSDPHLKAVKAYISIIVPDIMMIANFLPKTIHALVVGRVNRGVWCQFSAFLAIVHIVALNFGTVIIASTTYRIVCGSKTCGRFIVIANVASWLIGIGIASVFLVHNQLGAFKVRLPRHLENRRERSPLTVSYCVR